MREIENGASHQLKIPHKYSPSAAIRPSPVHGDDWVARSQQAFARWKVIPSEAESELTYPTVLECLSFTQMQKI